VASALTTVDDGFAAKAAHSHGDGQGDLEHHPSLSIPQRAPR
jgi:hypothetical protein